jgi:hypothetical protein
VNKDVNTTAIQPWLLNDGDVITVDPDTGATGEWPVTGHAYLVGDATVVTCALPDGGEGVIVYKGAQKAVIAERDTTPQPRAVDGIHVIKQTP